MTDGPLRPNSLMEFLTSCIAVMFAGKALGFGIDFPLFLQPPLKATFYSRTLKQGLLSQCALTWINMLFPVAFDAGLNC